MAGCMVPPVVPVTAATYARRRARARRTPGQLIRGNGGTVHREAVYGTGRVRYGRVANVDVRYGRDSQNKNYKLWCIIICNMCAQPGVQGSPRP